MILSSLETVSKAGLKHSRNFSAHFGRGCTPHQLLQGPTSGSKAQDFCGRASGPAPLRASLTM